VKVMKPEMEAAMLTKLYIIICFAQFITLLSMLLNIFGL